MRWWTSGRRDRYFRQGERGLGRDPGHFAKTISREILRLALFDSLQHEAGDEFGLVTPRNGAEGPPPAELPILFLPKFVAVMSG